uniref:Uncharacterized protein n=2 Tax=Opuntia streptacantha TaxID=393608 RepID=A0A7C9DAW7_OPUST
MAGTSSSSHHHLINQPQQSQAVFNPQLDNPLHSFVLIKREQNLINLPPWLDHHLSSSASASSPIFHQDHQQLMRQDNQNPSMGLIMTSASGGAPYHTQVPPEMSATALLQKAAQMGSTMSNTKNDPQGHVSGTNSSAPNTAGLFGVNLSSRDHHGLSSFGNKAAPPLPPRPTPTPTQPPPTNFNTGGSSDQITGPTPSSSASMLHDMMINSLSSSSSYNPHDDAFGIGGMLKKEAPLAAFHQTLGGSDFRTSCTNGGGSGGGNEGLTRDFLGLRPLSQNDILTLAGLGNCITTNPTSHDHSQDHHHHHHHTHKPW